MGMEDRDYWREAYAKRNGMQYDSRKGVYRKSFFAKKVRNFDVEDCPPDVPGVDFHWSLKILIWLAVLAISFCAYSFIEKNRDAARHAELIKMNVEFQRQRAERERKFQKELQNLKQQQPTVDFFK